MAVLFSVLLARLAKQNSSGHVGHVQCAGAVVGGAGSELGARKDAALPGVLLDGLAARGLLPGHVLLPVLWQAAARAAVCGAHGL